MGSKSARDVQLELSELEIEEARIMRELREMDEKANVARLRVDGKADPRAVLNTLLGECEREVREAKGFIKSTGPPLLIARCKRGEAVPPHATFLSRPKSTGVDFTIPVKLKEYNDAIKHPIFLDGIRDKCRALAYASPDDYLADMRLLARNTAAFNKGPELSWVVQHARLLLETAEESVQHRRRELADAAAAIPRSGSSARPGKRKRSVSLPAAPDANGSALAAIVALAVGTSIQIFWDSDRKWYTATVREKGEGAQVLVEYQHEGAEWLDLQHEVKWRMPPLSASGRSKRIAENAHNKRKKGSSSSSAPPPVAPRSSSRHLPPPAPPAPGVAPEALHAVRDEVLAAIEDAKAQVLTGVHTSITDRFLRVETALNRSDALHRVLLAVTDMQSAMAASVSTLAKDIDTLQGTVAGLAARLEKGGRPGAPAQPDAGIGRTEKAPEASAKQGADGEPENARPADVQPKDAQAAAAQSDSVQPDSVEPEAVEPEEPQLGKGDGVSVEPDADKEKAADVPEADRVETKANPLKPSQEPVGTEPQNASVVDVDKEVIIIDDDDSEKVSKPSEKEKPSSIDVSEKKEDLQSQAQNDGSDISAQKQPSPEKPDKSVNASVEQNGVKVVEKEGETESEKPTEKEVENMEKKEKGKPDVEVEMKMIIEDAEKEKSHGADVTQKPVPLVPQIESSPKKRAKSKSSDSDSSSGSDSSDDSSSSGDESESSSEKKKTDESEQKDSLPPKSVHRSESDMSLDSSDAKQPSPRKVQGELKPSGDDPDVMDIAQDTVAAPAAAATGME